MTSETQAVSAKWRVLTKQYVKRLEGGVAIVTPEDIRTVIKDIVDILSLSGFQSPHDLVAEGQDLDRKIRGILRQCIELRDTIGEQVLSCDYQPLAPESLENFDKVTMEDAYESRKEARKQEDCTPILCTTELGLMSYEKAKSEDGSKEVDIRPSVHLKAKVVTIRAVRDLLSDGET